MGSGRADGKSKSGPGGGTAAPPAKPAKRTRKRIERGAKLRDDVDPAWNGEWTPQAGRKDPMSLLKAQAATREPDLVPIRYGRMLASPFAFFRGSAAIMAGDLGPLPTTNLRVQSSGDAHLLNFGVFAAPDRRLVFDLNDFDETLPAPFEWDVKRLATSCVIAARDNGAGREAARRLSHAAVEAYQAAMWRYASERHLDLFYERIEVRPDTPLVRERVDKASLSRFRKDFAKAESRTSLAALERLARRRPDGGFELLEAPPLILRAQSPEVLEEVPAAFARYVDSLEPDKAAVVQRYRLQDVARKVVGVGSVGVRAYMLLLMGDRDDDALFLQLKEAQESVLAPYAGPSAYEHQGERVVRGQKLVQSASDLFLGWLTHPVEGGRDYYVRQLRDKKGSIKIARLTEAGLTFYAQGCGAVLARAHARTGDPAKIAGYLGRDAVFAEAVSEFAVRYAHQNERDYEALLEAETEGRIEVRRGV